MTQTVMIIVLSTLSVLGILFVLQLAVRGLLLHADAAVTVKIIREKAPRLEYAVRTAEAMLDGGLQRRTAVLLVVCEESDTEEREITLRLNEEYGNIVPCEQRQLAQEIMRISGLQSAGERLY